MWDRIIAFFASFIAFFAAVFNMPLSDGTIQDEGYTYKNMQYGYHQRQKVDLYLPSDSDGEVGLVLFIHGGAWVAGNKEDYGTQPVDTMKKYGYATASLNYRYISGKISTLDILDDIDACLLRIKEKAAEKGITINKVLLTGGSAGAHLSMLYAYARYDTAPITPAAVVSYSGPTDLADDNYYNDNPLGDNDKMAELLSEACGKKFKYENRSDAATELGLASPVSYVNENTVPTVINHGVKDTVVPYSNAQSIVEKFEQYGVTYELNTFPNSNHGLESDPENWEIASALLEEYMLTYLGEEK